MEEGILVKLTEFCLLHSSTYETKVLSLHIVEFRS